LIALDDIQPDVWLLSCENIERGTLALWSALLSEQERAKAGIRIRLEDQISYIAAHALLRSVLSEQTGAAPQDLSFKSATQYGKPALHPESGIRFNLSHCDGLSAVVLAKNFEAGIDAENINARGLADALTAASFHPSEFDLLSRASADEKKHIAARIWTAKEAYVKALGLGLTLPFSSFYVELSPPAIKAQDVTHGATASLWAHDFLGSHVVSVCMLDMPAVPLEPRLHLAGPHDLSHCN